MAERELGVDVDVFISYSQRCRDLTKSLAAALEAEGFSTWWDTDLVAGDNFRDKIDKQIEASKAVIIIWTPESAQSVWVKSEATHALRLKKLVNLRVPELKTDDIPKPFGEFHSVVIDNRTAIIVAVKQRIEQYKSKTLTGGTDALPPAGPARPGAESPAQQAPREARRTKLAMLRQQKRYFLPGIVAAVCGISTLIYVGSKNGWISVAELKQQAENPTKPNSTSAATAQKDLIIPPMPGTYKTQQNYADELTDFGVPPQRRLQSDIRSKTPSSILGVDVVTTIGLRNARRKNEEFLLVDAFNGPHATIPGAVRIPSAGKSGSFKDDNQRALQKELDRLTNGDRNYPIVFFCAGAYCWESYNAALRAIVIGFKKVYWYRGGLSAWQEAGFSVEYGQVR